MAKSVLELAVGTGQWDAGLKKAKSALDNFTQSQGGLQQALDKESQKMQKFVQMMGGMESTAKTAKGQMNDYKSTIEQLTMQYNRMTEAQKKVIGQDYLQAIEQMKQKYQSVNEEIQEMNRSLNNVKLPDMKDGGGLFSGLGDKMSGAFQVFAGNMLTKAAGAVASLGSEMVDMVKQGVEMAKAGEGIRIAFERLGRGDILDGLREATHGTVTDLELMKAAVKFNDFKLPVEELGTMLAFAQQKAKDTGQSVDYMVDSIVTGLGRKSLMILDNLGLSANDIKEKMKETGDMTKAVGEIIREQMAKAGDYVETAADRAAQANVSLQNKMEELGRKFAPLEEASSSLWTSMKIGILDLVGGPLTDLLNKLTQAGRMANAYGLLGGSSKVGRLTSNLSNASEGNRQSIYQQQQAQFWRYINPREQMIKDIRAWQRGERGNALSSRVGAIAEKYGMLDATKIQAEVDAAKKMLADYQKAAQQILKPIKQDIDPNIVDDKGGHSGKGGKAEIEAAIGSIDYQTKKVQELQKAWRAAADDDSREKIKKEIEEQQYVLDRMTGKEKFDPSKMTQIQGVSVAPNTALPDLKLPDVSKQKQEIQAELKLQQVKVDEETLKTLMKDAVQNSINGMDFQFSILGEKIGRGVDVPDSAWQQILDEYNALREQIGLEPIKIDFKTGGLEEAGEDAKSATKDFQQAASAIGSVGSALSSIEDPSAKIAGIVAQAIATVASAFAGALHTDGTTKSNIWAFIGAAAASTATMISTIASIHSATGYAQGGMIKGNSYSGDNIVGMVDGGGIVGLNAGEIVLNQAQTANVANALEGSGMRGIDLSASVSGEQILLVANRTTRRQGRGELVTWK